MTVSGPTIGLVGCGDWGRHVLRDLGILGCRTVVAARGAASCERAVEGGAEAIVRSPAELPEVDGIVVATPTTTHAEVVAGLLERQVPIFVEKPMTADPESALRLAAAAPERLFVMDKWRYHPGVELLAGVARSGELGEVVGVRTRRVGWGNPHSDVDCVWILAPHDLAIGLEILGELPRARCARADRVGDEVCGLRGLLGETPWLDVEVSVREPVRSRRVTLLCERGAAVLPQPYAEHVEVYPGAPLRQAEAPQPTRRVLDDELPLLRELRCFVEHLAGGPAPRSSAREGAEIVVEIARLRELAGLED